MKKVFILFMSHESGEHGLTIHNSIEEVQAEVKSVVEIIHEDRDDGAFCELLNEAYNNDLKIVEEITGDGTFNELSDTTWFDVFEREIQIETDLRKAFEDGRKYEAGELELNTAGRETAFEVWFENQNL